MIEPKFLHGVLEGTNSRFTEKQIKHYEFCSEKTALRARCLSGAFIAAKSRSRTIDITLKLLGRARNYLGIDVEVDGTVAKSLRIMDIQPETAILGLRLLEFPDERPREIKVYLPVSVEIEIVSFSADGEPLPRPEKKILFLGDSITQGMDCVSPLCAYSCVVAKIMNLDYINQGVGGHTFDPDTLDENFPFIPDIITVAYGVNDWNKDFSADLIEQNVSSYFEKLGKIFLQSKIFVITPIWTEREDQKKAAGTLQDIRKIIENLAKKTGFKVIDGLSLVPHNSFYFVDGVHPNEAGHLIYGINLASQLMAHIKR